MSRRTAIVEEFDDDTELPLPSKPLPNTGARGPLLEEIVSSGDDDDDDDEFPMREPTAGPASPSSQQQFRASADDRPSNSVTDITPYKKWTCIYPIYIDAKRPYATGERRVAREKSVWWPLSKDIADATNRMGLGTLHEVNKAHPRDWENPGRVRVQWKKDGRFLHPTIRTKKQLLEMISSQIQRIKPDNVPKPPYQTSTPKNLSPPVQSKAASTKSKHPSTKPKPPTSPVPAKQSNCRLPVPPDPQPPLASRVSAYSPAIPTGMLIETIKAGMSAQDTGGGAGALPGAAGGAAGQKGKRKVVRVRG